MSYASDMRASHIIGKRNTNTYEPQRGNNFKLAIQKGNTGLDLDKLDLAVATFTAPQLTTSPISVSYANTKTKFAGLPEFADSSLTINDFIGLDSEKILSDWQKKVYNPETGKIGLASNYKTNAVLYKFSPNGILTGKYAIKGCWISSLQVGDFNQEDATVKKVTVTLTYDYAYQEDTGTINFNTSNDGTSDSDSNP